jgi:hypothetical protein
MQFLVLAGSPLDFPGWSASSKLDRYRRVVEWHNDYLPKQYGSSKITHSWGSHEVLSRFDPTTSLGILSAVYDVESFDEFDELINLSPLRDVSRLTTLPLCSLFEDKRSDYERTERAFNLLMKGKSERQREVIEEIRSRYSGPPEFVGQLGLENPQNLPNTLEEETFSEGGIRVMLVACNPNNLIESWDDVRKQVLYEKVNWWFDYMAMMIGERRVTHAWGTHDFCNIEGMSVNSKGAVHTISARDFDDFHISYNLDPLREWARFHTIVLNPIAKQRALDELRLREAEKRYG